VLEKAVDELTDALVGHSWVGGGSSSSPGTGVQVSLMLPIVPDSATTGSTLPVVPTPRYSREFGVGSTRTHVYCTSSSGEPTTGLRVP
jgi:hypothetical protein